MSKKLVLMCILAVAICPVANATQVVSSDFSIGIGFTHWGGWETVETAAVNTSFTQGDFTFSPSVTGREEVGSGCLFTDRVLAGVGANGGLGGDEPGYTEWTLTLNGSYNGVVQAGGVLTINITGMSIYGLNALGTQGTFWFTETTSGHTAVSPSANTIAFSGIYSDPASYTQLSWNPDDYQVTGESATRTFGIDEANASWIGLDGFEIYGNVTYEYIPEPATMLLLCAGGLFFRKK